MSGRPSPLRSPAATPHAFQPVPKFTRESSDELAKLPSVLLFWKIDMKLDNSPTAEISGLPSPSKSAIATPCVQPGVGKSTRGEKELVVSNPLELTLRWTLTKEPCVDPVTKSVLPSPSR